MNKDEGGGEEPFTNELQLMMYSKTWNITTSITIASEGKEMVMPGKASDVRTNVIMLGNWWKRY